MSRRICHLAVVLLLLVLPLQALAAGLMLVVSQTYHANSLAGFSTTVAHGEEVGPTVAAHHEHSGAGGLVPHHHDGDGSTDSACSGCGECCCPVSLLSAQSVAIAAIDGSGASVPFLASPVPDVLPHRLERPPRSFVG